MILDIFRNTNYKIKYKFSTFVEIDCFFGIITIYFKTETYYGRYNETVSSQRALLIVTLNFICQQNSLQY